MGEGECGEWVEQGGWVGWQSIEERGVTHTPKHR